MGIHPAPERRIQDDSLETNHLPNRGPLDDPNRELDAGAQRVGLDLKVVEFKVAPIP